MLVEETELRDRGQFDEAKAKAEEKARQARIKNFVPPGKPHDTLGYKFTCWNCGLKFYDMNKPDPVCPKCNEDQRDKPSPSEAAEEARQAAEEDLVVKQQTGPSAARCARSH